MVDFKKRLGSKKTEKPTDPLKLYETLDRAHAGHGYCCRGSVPLCGDLSGDSTEKRAREELDDHTSRNRLIPNLRQATPVLSCEPAGRAGVLYVRETGHQSIS